MDSRGLPGKTGCVVRLRDRARFPRSNMPPSIFFHPGLRIILGSPVRRLWK